VVRARSLQLGQSAWVGRTSSSKYAADGMSFFSGTFLRSFCFFFVLAVDTILWIRQVRMETPRYPSRRGSLMDVSTAWVARLAGGLIPNIRLDAARQMTGWGLPKELHLARFADPKHPQSIDVASICSRFLLLYQRKEPPSLSGSSLSSYGILNSGWSRIQSRSFDPPHCAASGIDTDARCTQHRKLRQNSTSANMLAPIYHHFKRRMTAEALPAGPNPDKARAAAHQDS